MTEIMMNKTLLLDGLWKSLKSLDSNLSWAQRWTEKLFQENYLRAPTRDLIESINYSLQEARKAHDSIIQFLQREKRSRVRVKVNKETKRVERLYVIDGKLSRQYR